MEDIIQELISAGHSWKDLLDYNLAEIGLFIKIITRKNRRSYSDKLSMAWLANNLSADGFKDVMKKLDPKYAEKSKPTNQEVRSNWRRLATLAKGLK